ncbi:MAG: PQQ-binding-like beta-propeller repeat protein [Bacteroidales bacterium]
MIIKVRLYLMAFTLLIPAWLYGQRIQAKPGATPDFNSLPRLSWTFQIGKAFFSSPVASENTVYIGGLDSILYAIDLSNGEERWRFHTKGEIRSSICIGGDTVYLNGGDGVIYALDKNNGKKHWNFATGGERKYDFADYFHSAPVLAGNLLCFGSGDSCLYALERESGKLRWKFSAGALIHTSPAVDNHLIFFGTFDGYVYALAEESGVPVWKFKTVGHRYFPKGEVQGSPVVFNGLVIIGARDYNVYALDQQKGYCHWNKAFTRGWCLSNTIHDSVLYILGADERILIAADPSSGREIWKTPMEFLTFGRPAFSQSLLYTGTTIGKLHGIAVRNGEKKWSFETESYRKNKLKYFKEDDSYRDDIYSIITSNEQFLEVECELGGIFSGPVIWDNYLLFSSTNGRLYCLIR